MDSRESEVKEVNTRGEGKDAAFHNLIHRLTSIPLTPEQSDKELTVIYYFRPPTHERSSEENLNKKILDSSIISSSGNQEEIWNYSGLESRSLVVFQPSLGKRSNITTSNQRSTHRIQLDQRRKVESTDFLVWIVMQST